MNRKQIIAQGTTGFNKHLRAYREECKKQGKVLLNNYLWRPYRFAVRDVIIGLVVVKHNRRDSLLEVDVCISTTLPQFEKHSGARLMTIFLLTEAFFCGGSMEIHFTRNVEGQKVPKDIVQYLMSAGIELKLWDRGVITANEARLAYLAVTPFSEAARQKVMELALDGRVSPERVCFMVHHGIWNLQEMEMILLGSEFPDRILLGQALPEQRHFFVNDLYHARGALLASFLDRKLAKRERLEGESVVEMEIDDHNLDVSFNPDTYAKVYRSRDRIPVPWIIRDGHLDLQPGQELTVFIRARNSTLARLYFQSDLNDIYREIVKEQSSSNSRIYCLLVPYDFNEILSVEVEAFIRAAGQIGLYIMVCPETILGLDKDAIARLERSGVIRQ